MADHVRSADQSERPPPSRTLIGHYPGLSCLSVPATLLGYGARGYCPTMFGEIARRRLAVRGGRLRPAKHAAELDTDRILRQLPPVDQLIRKFGDLALVEFAVVGLKCTACGHRGASALMGRPSEPGARGSGTGWRRHVRRPAPTAQDSQPSIASVVASVGGDRGVMRTVADAPSASSRTAIRTTSAAGSLASVLVCVRPGQLSAPRDHGGPDGA